MTRPVCGPCSDLHCPCDFPHEAPSIILYQPPRPTPQQKAKRKKRSEQRGNGVATPFAGERLSRSRYVPPQHFDLAGALPWQRSASNAHRMHDMAIARFFAHYVIPPVHNVGDDGYLADLPYFYARSVDGSALQNAVRACSLASYANWTRRPQVMHRALRAYGEALRGLRTSLQDAGQIRRDETLMTLLVLDYFTVRKLHIHALG